LLYAGPIDGVVGPDTTAAVRAFQRREGLAVDGVVGARTRAALGRYGRHALGSRPLARGAFGWDAAELQFLLAGHGFPSGPFDGRAPVSRRRPARPGGDDGSTGRSRRRHRGRDRAPPSLRAPGPWGRGRPADGAAVGRARLARGMSLRVCLVSPFDWSQPHDVNEHVAGLAAGLRDLGHTVTVLAPSSRAIDLIAGRRAILNGEAPEVAAIAAAVPISRRSRMGVAMGARANLSLALAVLEWRPAERQLARATIRVLRELPGWELVLLRTKPLSGRPYVPPDLRERVHIRTARDGATRAGILGEASIFLPALTGLARVKLEAQAAGAALAEPPGMREQPELAAAALARLAEDADFRARTATAAREAAASQSFAAVAADHDELYTRLARRRRPRGDADPLGNRDWILCDLPMH